MDHEVIEVLRELGCFSAGALPEPREEEDELDELWIDLGGEG
jgi:hypothetical protein